MGVGERDEGVVVLTLLVAVVVILGLRCCDGDCDLVVLAGCDVGRDLLAPPPPPPPPPPMLVEEEGKEDCWCLVGDRSASLPTTTTDAGLERGEIPVLVWGSTLDWWWEDEDEEDRRPLVFPALPPDAVPAATAIVALRDMAFASLESSYNIEAKKVQIAGCLTAFKGIAR